MFHIEDEFAIESYRIPWLIWIQLLVFFLLLALLFFFALFPSDPGDTATAAPSAASSSLNPFIFDDIQQIQKPLANRVSTPSLSTNRQHQLPQGGRNLSIKEEIETGSSMIREENSEADDASSLNFLHPCHYFQLATVAFLKCFGLDSTSDSPPTRKHRKSKGS